MHIAGENGNVSSWVADWPQCCDLEEVVQDSAMCYNGSKGLKITGKCPISLHRLARLIILKATVPLQLIYEVHNKENLWGVNEVRFDGLILRNEDQCEYFD